MNQTLIIQRAFELVKRYRVLWILGILLAITGGAGSGAPNGNVTWNSGGEPLAVVDGRGAVVFGMVVVGLICVLFLLGLAAVVVRYVVQAGLFRTVDQIEDANQAPSFKEAFKLGWNWRAFRLFLIDLIVFVPLGILAVVAFFAAFTPLLLLIPDNTGIRIFGILLTIGLFLLILLLAIVIGALVSLLMHFIQRAAVLDDAGVIDSIKQGVRMVREHFQDVFVMWLLMVGIGLAYGLLLLPVMILLGGAALVVAGGPAWLLYELTNGPVLSLLWGIPVGLAIFIIPLVLIGGLYEAFKSSVWTLTYREVKALSA